MKVKTGRRPHPGHKLAQSPEVKVVNNLLSLAALMRKRTLDAVESREASRWECQLTERKKELERELEAAAA